MQLLARKNIFAPYPHMYNRSEMTFPVR